MRIYLINIFLFFSVVLTYAQWKSFKIYEGDTINKIDNFGNKQGLWIFFNEEYANGVVQKGYYKDGKKDGEWIVYYPNGKIKSKAIYRNNRIYGSVISYYPNGNIQEKGVWKGNKWVGEYFYYYENGKIKYHWNYNERGKRDGEQYYYYDNGQLYVVGKWQNGKETGEIKEYYPNGQLRRISTWESGFRDGPYIEYYNTGQLRLKKYFVIGKEDSTRTQYYAYIDKTNVQETTQDSLKNYKQFSGYGFFRFYNADGKLISEGEYRKGQLYQGKKYYYDKKGKLVKVAYIEQGRVVRVETPQN